VEGNASHSAPSGLNPASASFDISSSYPSRGSAQSAGHHTPKHPRKQTIKIMNRQSTKKKGLITCWELTGKLLGLTSSASPVPKMDSSEPSSPSSLPHPSDLENLVPYSNAVVPACPLEPEKYKKRRHRHTIITQHSTTGLLLCPESFLPLISDPNLPCPPSTKHRPQDS